VNKFGLMIAVLWPLTLTACAPVASPAQPERIVSIDYCADQMVLGLVERERIAAVSVDVASDPAFSLPRADGLPRVRAEVERVLAMRPTLVVRSYGGGPRFATAMERAGVPVFTLPYAATLDDVDDVMAAAGQRLGAQAMASRRRDALAVALTDARQRAGSNGTALYVTPGDVTTGPGSMIAELVGVAGYRSYENKTGWHRLPVERLLADPPDLVVRGFFETAAHRQDRWASSGHAALRRAVADVPMVDIPGSELSCGNWLIGHAATRIAAVRRTP
jgi:iron complex transport system substrate-binding protein